MAAALGDFGYLFTKEPVLKSNQFSEQKEPPKTMVASLPLTRNFVNDHQHWNKSHFDRNLKSKLKISKLDSSEPTRSMNKRSFLPRTVIKESPSNRKAETKSKFGPSRSPSESQLVHEVHVIGGTKSTLHRNGQFKKGSKLAAKFDHIEFDPSRLRPGAVPPSKKRALVPMDNMKNLKHADVTGVPLPKRRRKVAKKLVMELESEDKSAPFISLFQ